MITPPMPPGVTAHCRASLGGATYCTVRRGRACTYLELRGRRVVRFTDCSVFFRPLQRYAPTRWQGPPA